MKRFIKVITCLFFLVSFVTENSIAKFYDGNKLSEYCSEYPNNSLYTGLCAGYIAGVYDSFEYIISFYSDYQLSTICFSKEYPNFNANQLTLTVKKYISDNPQYLNDPGTFLVSMTIIKYFPIGECLKKSKAKD